MKKFGKTINSKSAWTRVLGPDSKSGEFVGLNQFKKVSGVVSHGKGLTVRSTSISNIKKLKGLGKRSVTDISDFIVNVKKPQFKRSWDAYANLIHTWNKSDLFNKTCIKALLLDNENCILGEVTINKTEIAEAELLDLGQVLIRNNAQSVVLGQNFLEARIRPSETEKKQAKLVKLMADNLNIKVKDQIILSDGAYYSFAENGLY